MVKVGPGITARELQDLIDDAKYGTLISLAGGNYYFDRTISIERNGVSVIGAGSDSTIINVRSDLGQEAFQVGSSARSQSRSLSASVSEGDATLRMAPGHDYKAGDHLMLSRRSTSDFFDSIGDKDWRRTEVPLRKSLVEIEAVDGNTIRLKSGAHFDFPARESWVQKMRMVEDVRLGGFTVDYGFGEANPSDFSNRLGLYYRDAVVVVENAADLVIGDLVSHDVPSHGISARYSTGIVVDSVEITGAHNKGGGGNGYSVWIGDVFDSSFTNISDRDMRHSVLFNSWTSAVGNEVHVKYTDRDINFHGGRDHGNVVMVDQSIRDANSDVWHPTLYINSQGGFWGSVTDPDANLVRFGKVVGTKSDDTVEGYGGGSWLEGRRGDDRLVGGAGNDMLIGGPGKDVLIGGAGEDIAAFSGRFKQFDVSRANGTVVVRDTAGNQSSDKISGVEWLLFDDGALRLSDMRFMARSAVDGVYKGYAQTLQESKEASRRPAPRETEDGATEPAAEDGLVYAVNIGSSAAFTAADGTVFAADTTGVGRQREIAGAIAGTSDDPLYQSEAWSTDGLRYDFALADGTYEVTLHFAEIWSGAFGDELRVFDVRLEGATVIDDLDIYARAGGNRAYVTTHVVEVSDGRLDLDFVNGVQNSKLSALEVRLADAATKPGPAGDARAPVSVDDRLKGAFGPDTIATGGLSEFRFDAAALLANDRVSGSASIEILSGPEDGELRVGPDGKSFGLVFDPHAFDGTDAIDYRLVDAAGRASDAATVQIAIGSLPRPKADGPEMVLIDARKDDVLMSLDEHMLLHESVWEGRSLTVAVAGGSGVESARFYRDGVHTRTENVEPYALLGDRRGDYWGGMDLAPGDQEAIEAKLYRSNGGKGGLVAKAATELTAAGPTMVGRDFAADVFAFDAKRMGRVTIEDFEAFDKLAFVGVDSASAVMGRSRVVDEDTRIDFGHGNVLTLKGCTDLEASDLMF